MHDPVSRHEFHSIAVHSTSDPLVEGFLLLGSDSVHFVSPVFLTTGEM